jgi:hypothetical protein
MKRDVPTRSGLLDHRGLWVIDIEYRVSGIERVGVGSRSNTRHAKSRFDHSRRSKGERGPLIREGHVADHVNIPCQQG